MRRISIQKNGVIVILALLLFSVSISSPHPTSLQFRDTCSSGDIQISLSQITQTREEALSNYITALYDNQEGYFHYALDAPPYEGLLGLFPGIGDINGGYLPLKRLDITNEIDWNSSEDLLLSFVNTDVDSDFYGLFNDSQSIGPTVSGQYMGMSLCNDFGITNMINTEYITNWIASCQQTDGGFSAHPDFVDSRLTYTYFAIEFLAEFGDLYRVDRSGCVTFVLSCLNGDGGFGVKPSSDSDSGVTPLVLMILDALDSMSDLNQSSLIDFELAHWNNETGCSMDESIVATERSLWSLSFLDALNAIDIAKAVDWILACQSHEDGSFRMFPGEDSDRLEFCRAAVHSLEIIDSLNSLDNLFSVQESPVWEAPQWYLDQISTLTTTTNGGPGGIIVLPDLRWILNGLITIAPFSLCLIPIGYYIYADRREKQRRRESKIRRKKRL